MDVGAAMETYRKKHPADFYGNTTDINFKDDLKDDQDGKVKFISERGYQAWAALPLNERSMGAANVVNGTIPSSFMRRSEYLKLSLGEKTKLASEIGAAGIGRIMARTK